MQHSNTKNMIFNVNRIIEYASRFFSFNIGDLIFTGTPAGAGASDMELKEEDVWTRDAQAGSIYYAIYENDFWEG